METIIVKAYRVLVRENDGTLVPTNVGRPWSQATKMISDALTQIIIDSIDTVPAFISSVLTSTGEFDDLGIVEDVTDNFDMEYTSSETTESNHTKWSMLNSQVVETYGIIVKKADTFNGDTLPSVNIVIIFKRMIASTGMPVPFQWYVPVRCYAFATEFFNRDDKSFTVMHTGDVYDFLNGTNVVIQQLTQLAQSMAAKAEADLEGRGCTTIQ